MDGRTIDNKTRRGLLKTLGIAGSATVGTTTLGQVRAAMPTPPTSESLTRTGASIHENLGGTINGENLREAADEFATAANGLNTIAESGVPDTLREDFAPVASAGRPIVAHLDEAGFYERTQDSLPDFTTDYIDTSVTMFAHDGTLADLLDELGFGGGDGVDMLASVVDMTDELVDRHWIGTDEITREMVGTGEYVPAMTRGAHEGSLLWLQDLDRYLWQNAVLVTEDIYRDAVWYARAMAAGFHLVTEGAIAAAEGDRYDDEQLAALLSVGFAVQTICDPRILQDVYWITDEERAPRRTDLEYTEVVWQ